MKPLISFFLLFFPHSSSILIGQRSEAKWNMKNVTVERVLTRQKKGVNEIPLQSVDSERRRGKQAVQTHFPAAPHPWEGE